MNKKVQVMIVEDQFMPPQLFELYISQSERYENCVSFDNAMVADIYCMKHHVDLILMDVITKNGANGLDAAERIKKIFPKIKIIIVTSLPEFSFISRAKKIGVEGFWYKEIAEEPIISLMNRVMDGEIVYPNSAPSVRIGKIESDAFSNRELLILKELIWGFSNTEIAQKLHYSTATVKRIIEGILEKTGCLNRVELAVKVRESGLVIFDVAEEKND